MTERILYSYFRSSAAYRVRMALNIKGLDYQTVAVDLREGQQKKPSFLQLNPQGLVPVLQDQGQRLSQSLAICEYLDEAYPHTPRLLPADPILRCHLRTQAMLIACDIHPLNNLRVLQYLEQNWQIATEQQTKWIQHWITQGFQALEAHLPNQSTDQNDITLADLCLVAQVYNARRYHVDLSPYPNIVHIDAQLNQHPAIAAAHPQSQTDTPATQATTRLTG